ncbi:hypothetical protein J3F83DRAFT_723907 [Trichoderma novae-zelandiae]
MFPFTTPVFSFCVMHFLMCMYKVVLVYVRFLGKVSRSRQGVEGRELVYRVPGSAWLGFRCFSFFLLLAYMYVCTYVCKKVSRISRCVMYGDLRVVGSILVTLLFREFGLCVLWWCYSMALIVRLLGERI